MSSENKFKNEMLIKIGAVEILLRPTFENISNLESKMGGIQYLAFKFARGSSAKTDLDKLKYLPTMHECAQIIYFCQAKTKADNEQEKEFSLEEIFEMLSGNMTIIPSQMMVFMGRMLAGNKNAPELSENTKKNSSKPSRQKSL